jgi:L-threonylcarbamoyladenylate synthase
METKPVAEAENFTRAVEALKLGEVIVFPTETVYGLGADALNGPAVDRVFALKGRDRHNPIPVLVADEEMLFTLVAEIPPTARKLINAFWPGPLTVVLPAQKAVPEPLLNRDGGVGVRISSQRLATALVRALGRPLTATSANPSGQLPARSVAEGQRYFAERIGVFVDGGTLRSKMASTVVQTFDNAVRIVREGAISAGELKRVLLNEELSG